MKWSITRRGALALGVAGLAPGALAQPLDRTARILTGFMGLADAVARLYGERLRGSYASQVIVDNRLGAAGRLAMEVAKASAPDGTTLLLTHESSLTVYPHVYPKTLRFDPQADFIAASAVATFPFVIGVGPGHPARDFAQFVAWAKAQPEVAFATPAAGSVPHFTMVQLFRQLGIAAQHVPYRDTTMIIGDLQQNRLPVAMSTIGSWAQLGQSGDLRLLATSGPQRAAILPAVPSFNELGLAELTTEEGYYMMLPARTPQPVVDSLHAAVVRAAEDPGLQDSLGKLGLRIWRATPADAAAKIRADTIRWAGIVRSSGYEPQE
ncbi:tripartite tricarboxylate transporter substrate-binding protein [Paracraurococcus lichenis]|uniref:Tripartite tricarboxylate transporter substrate-binding protein n=1 Tax=Paracraurococcus lichenis TaxID=3064888 RepID=A0ABT9E2N9_9PROT|nr:tripartite tricarboxylate transporter substrate-binding protein [Paracraurococcus sp. LOR1-02]MDO9710419.1 tripartite tricarboxylate transporter substrate-binding protein [Paracraurococcus sp. LOR1-02]